MKHKHLPFVFTLIILTITHSVQAKIWRVNNNGYSADFTGLQAANGDNRVAPGDTIHLEGSATSYGSANITKRLIILGPGYFLTSNPGNSANALSANITYITFSTGSQGSQLQGIYVGNSSFGITVNVSNILIKRCRIDYDVNLTYAISDVRILQNFFTNTGGNSTIIGTSSFGFPTDVVLNNNIIQRPLILPDGYTLLECNNNVFDSPALPNTNSISISAGTFKNNILTNPSVNISINNGSFVNVTHNISASSNQFGTTNNNIIVTNRSSLFVDASASTDGNYQLRPGSPGTANGSDGTDRGAFGGLSPAVRYTLSGLPPVPVIYELTTSGVGTPSGLSVTVKARTIK